MTAADNNASVDNGTFSYHRDGANVVVGDGAIRRLNENVNILMLRALLRCDDKEVINDDDWASI